ncbi:ImmA/IrrE family metallo-endopeptidase, partial [Patescibacteria group bacterium]|nr:ImmA/IrrE family metallo-endopeptidase [Patescibacteria group bacterium]
MAWLRKGVIDGLDKQTGYFNERKLKSCLKDLKSLTKSKPKEFVPRLQNELAGCGVALVFTPGLPKTYVCGAARWLNPNKAFVQLSLRGGFADIMWFTFYHELAHILLHSKRDTFIDFDKFENGNIEQEANLFAANQLIPKDKMTDFLKSRSLTGSSIKDFADKLNVHPVIVVGRLQHDKIIR